MLCFLTLARSFETMAAPRTAKAQQRPASCNPGPQRQTGNVRSSIFLTSCARVIF